MANNVFYCILFLYEIIRMKLIDIIKSRRSVRKYQDKPIPKGLLEQILEGGMRAPSSMNRQPWRFVVVTNADEKKILVDEAKKELGTYLLTDDAKKKWGEEAAMRFMERAKSDEDVIFYNAPVVVLVLQTMDLGNGNFDHGLCTENILLSAHSLGISSCPIGLSRPMGNSPVVREKLGMKEDEKIVIGICLGYADEVPDEKERNYDVVTWLE